jgi:hypothetical protein
LGPLAQEQQFGHIVVEQLGRLLVKLLAVLVHLK